jgi:5-methylcytosine-specific restriction endonuclease McrA
MRKQCKNCKTELSIKEYINCCSDKCRINFLTKNKNKRELKNKRQVIRVRLKSNGCFYDSDEWKRLRYKILIKFGRKCMCCFRFGVPIHVDHIKPVSKFPELAFEFDNLQVLCADCNLGKSNRHEHDFRPDIP